MPLRISAKRCSITIPGSYGGEYEHYCLLGCCSVQSRRIN
jgi:hypothetical protein